MANPKSSKARNHTSSEEYAVSQSLSSEIEASDLEGRGVAWAGLNLERQLLLWSLTLFVLGAVLYFLSPVLAPFVAGTALGYLLDPVADRLQKLGLSRLSAALLLLVLFIAVVVTATLILFPILSRQFTGLITALPGYLQTLQGLISDWHERFTSDYFSEFIEKMGLSGAASSFDAQKYINELTDQATNVAGEFLKSLIWRGYALI
ncbi:MAG: AI-2E family transporter, partial [Methylocystis sp.]